MPQPNPGSPEADVQGCTCQRIDNGHGKGAYMHNGKMHFWYTLYCPVHTQKEDDDNA